jgi:hypothetical protein
MTCYDSSKIYICYILKLIWSIRWISENINHVFEFSWLFGGIFSDKLVREMIKIWNSIITKLSNTLVDKTQARLVIQSPPAWIQASATRTALFEVSKQRVAVIPYWRFSRIYWYHIQGSRMQNSFLTSWRLKKGPRWVASKCQ